MTAQLPLPLPHEPSFAREDFLAAPENKAALALINSWPRWPSPLMLLVGPPGSGKSHLGAIFVGATLAKAVAGGDLGAVDAEAASDGPALLIDDADAVGAAEAPLFHVLNFARQRGTSVLMTARAPPDLWGVATPDLLSRLRLAPIVEIGPPEVSLVEAVLTKLFSDRQLAVEPALGRLYRPTARSLARRRPRGGRRVGSGGAGAGEEGYAGDGR